MRSLQVAQKMSELQAFVHISTSYVNAHMINMPIEERMYPQPLGDPETLFRQLNEMSDEEILVFERDIVLKTYPSTYTFTKSMGEHLMQSRRESSKVPIVIVRMPVVCAALSEPLPGWCEGVAGLTAIMVVTGTGAVQEWCGDETKVMDVVPVDVVCKTTLMAGPALVSKSSKFPFQRDAVPVIQMGSSSHCPVKLGYIFCHFESYWQQQPQVSRRLTDDIRTDYYSIQDFPRRYQQRFSTELKLAKASKEGAKKYGKMLRKAQVVPDKFLPYLCYQWFLESKNGLWLDEVAPAALSSGFGAGIDWHEYLHLYNMGVHEYLLGEAEAFMLAIDAPPGQGKPHQPFVHYRCMCSSPGPSSTATKPSSASSQTEGEQHQDSEMNIDRPLQHSQTPPPPPLSSKTSSADALIVRASPFNDPEPHHHHEPRSMEEIYASGNNSDEHGSLSLSRLYFCDVCDEIRCPKCTQDEIVCYYCPNCLFDVPTASVKSEKHKCSRNCFECPICQTTLSVVSEDPDAVPFAPGSSATGQYHLSCNMCQWNSNEIGMTFDKPTGLAGQVQVTDEGLPDIKEYDRLKEHLEKYFRINGLKPGIPSSLLSSIQTGTIQSLRHVSAANHKAQLSDDIAHYTPAVQVMEDTENLEKLMSVVSLDETTSMKQRLCQLQNQTYSTQRLQPQRIHLRIKKSRRCRSCRHILIKPDQKAVATKFKINLVALSQLPNITIAQVQQPMIVQTVSTVILRFTNPRQEEAQVSLQVGDGAQPNHGVRIISKEFSIAPFNEVWEYEVGTLTAPPGQFQEDVYDKTANSTSIALEITPVAPGQVKIPLLVTFGFKARKPQTEMGSPKLPSELVLSGTVPPAPEVEYVDKKVSFWTVIGFGDAVPTFSS
ncbi:hypothetical protein BGZ83_007689 [Gryganskiella cystojenkinii]|nr:hypothetical protein BGZ83_007689 [Gryganskiella cystojenkinii]